MTPFSLAALGTVTLLACGASPKDPTSPAADEVRSDKPFAPDRSNVSNGELRLFWTEQLKTAILVYGAIASEQPLTENFAYSPTSVSLALAMTSAGASGEALAQISSTMGFPEQSALHDLMAVSTGALLGLNHDTQEDPITGVIDAQVVNVVNSLWPQAGLPLQTPFLDEMSASYDTGVYPVDYVGAAEEARLTINGWVGDETQDRISELIPEGVLRADTRITLVNAIYLKAPWANTFNPGSTQSKTFHAQTASGSSAISTLMMKSEMTAATARVVEGETAYRVLELGYGHGDLSFVAVFPDCPTNDECDFGSLAPVPATKLPEALATQLQDGHYSIELPKFEIRSASSLADAFKALGMLAPFDGGLDLIAENQDFLIQDIIHEAYIAIDEKGTEAAAATAVGAGPTSIPETIAVNRAFWFVIRDNTHGIPLFIGFVADPR